MVRKFSPAIETEQCYGGGESSSEWHYAVMVESEQGTYVKLETFLDETKRLRAMICRLEESSTSVEDKLKTLLLEYSAKEGWTEWDKGNLYGICLALEAVNNQRID